MKICIIGAGKRIHEMYGPMLSSVKDLNIAGFWNRDEEKGNKVTQKFGWKRFSDLHQMITSTNPDVVLVVVNSSSIKQVVLNLMKYKIPLIMETPVWDQEIPLKAKELGVEVFVNEQTPYLPCEEFKMLLLESGLFGKLIIAMNDCRTFEYHGISQLRRYIGYEKKPVEVVGTSIPHYPIKFADNNGNIQQHTEGWDFGTIKFDSGQTAVYNFSSIANRAPFRKPRSIRMYCSLGTISNDDNHFDVYRLTTDGITEKIDVIVDGEYMDTKSISAKVDNKMIEWKKEKDLYHLNDQQIAIRNVLLKNISAIKNKTEGYTSFSAALDVNLLFAIRHSANTKKFIQ